MLTHCARSGQTGCWLREVQGLAGPCCQVLVEILIVQPGGAGQANSGANSGSWAAITYEEFERRHGGPEPASV
eukprot:2070421-Heterocapsa_arctica.AAC.1